MPLVALALLLQPPRQPPGAGLLPQRNGTKTSPPPQPGDSGAPRTSDKRVMPTADKMVYDTESGLVIATGHVNFIYDGYIVSCERATYDNAKDFITFESNVRMETGREIFYAERIGFNQKTREFEALEARTILQPDRIGRSLLEPLSIWGKTMRREGNILKATDGFLTTCDLPNPHAKFGFRYAELLPKKRITMRDVTLYRYNTPIARIKHLTIPIGDDVRYSYLPTMGRTDEEGYFIKAVIGYSLARTLPGLLRVDLMQKKGVGLGADQAYRFGDTAAGRVNFYTLNDKSRGTKNFNGRVEHEQRFGEVDARFTTDFQNNSYLAATQGSKTQNSSLTLNRNLGKVGTTVNLGLNNADNSGSGYKTSTYGLKQQLPVGKDGQLSFGFTGTENLSTASTSRTLRIQQASDLRVTGTLGAFRAELVANRNLRNESSGATNSGFFGGTERLPELTLTANQIHGPLANLFSNAVIGYGQFLEGLSGTTPRQLNTQRFLLQTNLKPVRKELNPRLSYESSGTFKQSIYDGGDAAQYVLTHRSTLVQEVSSTGSVNLTYSYNRPYGGTPSGFRNDFVSSVNGLGINYRTVGGHAGFTLGTGYDLIQARETPIAGVPRSPWNQLQFTQELRPSGDLYSKLTGSYDINRGKLVSLDHYGHFQARDRSFLDTSARYDPTAKKLREVIGILATPIFDDSTRLIGNNSYNNITHKFNYNTLSITREFHDYEITVSYVDQPFGFRTEKGINLSFRLKAFASPQTNRSGRYGTPLDTSFGGVF